MTIEISENTLGIWFISWPEEKFDWLASAWRKPDGTVEGSYRFRYYKGADAWTSEDDKNWYSFKSDELGADMASTISKFAATVLAARPGGKKWEVLRGDLSFDEFFDCISQLPFMHIKELHENDCRIVMKEHGVNITVTAIHKETGKRASATGPANQKPRVRSQAVVNLAELLYGPPRPPSHTVRTGI